MIDPAIAITGMLVEGAVVMWLLPSRHLDSPKEETKKAVLFFLARLPVLNPLCSSSGMPSRRDRMTS